MHTWVSGFGDSVLFTELRDILEREQPDSIAVNLDPDLVFAGGMHAGELEAIREGLGRKWSDKLVGVPQMLAVEVVGTMVESKSIWYMKLMSTAWAIISEAFSERVIRPGITTTTVSSLQLRLVTAAVCGTPGVSEN